MNLPKLDARLRSAVDFVRLGTVAADVGTDHAYLPIFLVGSGRANRAVASDINRGPIESARANIAACGLADRIDTIQTDGLHGLEAFRPRDILLFGMGGELMVRILSEAPWVRDEGIRLILQPMTHAQDVRLFLAGNGFAVIGEALSAGNGKIYQTLAAEYTGAPYAADEVWALVGSFAQPGKDPLREAFLRRKIEVLEAVARGKRTAGREDGEESRLIEKLKSCL